MERISIVYQIVTNALSQIGLACIESSKDKASVKKEKKEYLNNLFHLLLSQRKYLSI